MKVTCEPLVGRRRLRNGQVETIRYDMDQIKVDGRTVGYVSVNVGSHASIILPRSTVPEAVQRRIRTVLTERDEAIEPGGYMKLWAERGLNFVPEEPKDVRGQRVRRKRRVRNRQSA